MDALHKLLFDTVMACAAGGGHVLRIHRRLWIGSRQLTVRGVATGAGSGHRQAALQQALAVDAFVVPGNNLALLAGIEQGGLLSLAVALGAKIGHVGGKGERLLIVLAQDVVRAVAVLAERGVGIALGMHLAVGAA